MKRCGEVRECEKNFEYLRFEFVSGFGFRYSDFEELQAVLCVEEIPVFRSASTGMTAIYLSFL